MDEVDDGEVAILIDGKDWFICKAIIFTGKGLVSDSSMCCWQDLSQEI
ncbi:MAG: hypothetical protein SPL79_09915 [Sphaerochaetaceae bacterium]|nr:hypothetical protein [Sphaerochaetaceae bacterium]